MKTIITTLLVFSVITLFAQNPPDFIIEDGHRYDRIKTQADLAKIRSIEIELSTLWGSLKLALANSACVQPFFILMSLMCRPNSDIKADFPIEILKRGRKLKYLKRKSIIGFVDTLIFLVNFVQVQERKVLLIRVNG